MLEGLLTSAVLLALFASGDTAGVSGGRTAVLVTVYRRAGCHLCDQVERRLAALSSQLDFATETVDIDSDRDLAVRYGFDIPVVAVAGRVVCLHFLDEAAVEREVKEVRATHEDSR